MAIYRCALCGSSRVAVDTQKEGFSVGKGIVGTALFGPAGALMGVNGKEQLYYHCAACGQTLSYPMSEITKNSIDRMLLNPQAFTSLLKKEKEQYPNIEWNDDSMEDSAASLLNADISLGHQGEILAKKILEYCSSHHITRIKKSDLTDNREIFRNFSYSEEEAAFSLLKQKGILTEDVIDQSYFLNFSYNPNEMRENITNQDATKIAADIRKEHDDELLALFLKYMGNFETITFGKASDGMVKEIIDNNFTDNEDVAQIIARLVIIVGGKRKKICFDLPKSYHYPIAELMNPKVLSENTKITYVANKRKRLLKEKRDLEAILPTLKDAVAEAEASISELLDAVDRKKYDDSNLQKEITSLKNEESEMVATLSSLQGIFKKKSRQKAQSKIDSLRSQIREKETQLRQESEKFQDNIRREKEQISQPVIKANSKLQDTQNSIKCIQIELEKLREFGE